MTHPGWEVKYDLFLGDEREVSSMRWIQDELVLVSLGRRVLRLDITVPTGELRSIEIENRQDPYSTLGWRSRHVAERSRSCAGDQRSGQIHPGEPIERVHRAHPAHRPIRKPRRTFRHQRRRRGGVHHRPRRAQRNAGSLPREARAVAARGEFCPRRARMGSHRARAPPQHLLHTGQPRRFLHHGARPLRCGQRRAQNGHSAPKERRQGLHVGFQPPTVRGAFPPPLPRRCST